MAKTAGIARPVVDALLDQLLAAHSRDEQVAITRALDRTLLAALQHPELWYLNNHRIAYRNRFSFVSTPPLHSRPAGLVAHSCGEQTMTPILRTLLASAGSALLLSLSSLSLAAGQHAFDLVWRAGQRYPASFKHFDFVNPDAPKGGELPVRLWRF